MRILLILISIAFITAVKADEIYNLIKIPNLDIYKIETKNKAEIVTELNKREERDVKLGFTSFGPHRDDVLFLWKKTPIRKHGSQGENKLFLALLKIAEHIYVSKKTKTTPIFLIDDLFAGLDKERSKKILSFISGLGISGFAPPQTIITTTDPIDIEKNKHLTIKNKITKHQMIENGIAKKSHR